MRTFAQKSSAPQQTLSNKSTIPGRTHLGHGRDMSSGLHLQRTIGNHAVLRLPQTNAGEPEVTSSALAPPRFAYDFSRIPIHPDSRTTIRPKLRVNTTANVDVQQGDGIAEQVMRVATSGSPSTIPYRNEMEFSFGADLSRVNAYFGRDDPMNRLNAHAATSGERVAFSGFSPDKKRVAHELTHILQQRRGGTMQPKSQLSGVDDAPEREAESVAARAAAGEHVIVSAAASSGIHRDIKDKNLEVPLGHFEIDMTKIESKGFSAGETGTISFTPNDKAPDSKSIRLSQARKTFDVDAKAEFDWSKDDPGDAKKKSNLNKMQTTASDKTHITAKGETLNTIAQQHYGEPSRFADVFAANKATLAPTMKVADGDKSLPEKLSLTIPTAILGGFAIDHLPAKFKIRTAKTDPVVPQDYVLPEEVGKNSNQHGSKAGKKVVPAMLFDDPHSGYHLQYTFETVARSDDAKIHYGTLHWSFDADPDKGVTKETHRVAPGVSDTFRAALGEFNKFYKNP